MHKIVLAITGASGSIYPKLLIEKLLAINKQWQELSVVMTENAKQVWFTEFVFAEIFHQLFKLRRRQVTGNGLRLAANRNEYSGGI